MIDLRIVFNLTCLVLQCYGWGHQYQGDDGLWPEGLQLINARGEPWTALADGEEDAPLQWRHKSSELVFWHRETQGKQFAPSTMRPLCFEQHNRRLVRSLFGFFFLFFFILIWSHNLSTDSIGSGSETLQPRSPSASSCLLLLLASGTAESTECRSESFALTYSWVNTGLELNR